MLPKWKGNCNDANPYSLDFPNRFEHYKLYRAGGVVLLTAKKGKLEYKWTNRAHMLVWEVCSQLPLCTRENNLLYHRVSFSASESWKLA